MNARLARILLGFVLLSSLAFAQTKSADVPRVIRFSGTLANADGTPRTGTVGIAFAIYADDKSPAPLWQEVQNVIVDATGHYTVLLGAARSEGLPAELFATNDARWLGIRVENEQEQPRAILAAVPYALKAADAETLGGKPLSAFVLNETTTNDRTADTGETTSGRASETKTALHPMSLGGVGTQNQVAKWTDSIGTLGNSVLTDTGTAVGLNNTSPTTSLDVTGTIRSVLSPSAPFGPYMMPTAGAANSFHFGFGYNLYFDGSNWRTKGDGVHNGGSAFLSDTGTGNLSVFTLPSTGATDQVLNDATFNTNERFRITSTGNVGINNTSPVTALDVAGTIRSVLSAAAPFGPSMIPTGGAANSFHFGFGYNLYFDGSNWRTKGDGAHNGGSAFLSDTGTGNLLVFTVPSTGASDQVVSDTTFNTLEKFRITSDGKVGIGTSNPTQALDVTGNVNASGNVTATGSVTGTTSVCIVADCRTAWPAGSVTSVAAGTGLTASPSPITSSGTLSFDTTFGDARYAQLGGSGDTFNTSLSVNGNVSVSNTSGDGINVTGMQTGGSFSATGGGFGSIRGLVVSAGTAGTDTTAFGVFSRNLDSTGYGVYGESTSTAANFINFGVGGVANSALAYGGAFGNSATGGTALAAFSGLPAFTPEVFTVKASGNVGIGTKVPTAKLNVIGGSIAIGSSIVTADAALHITDTFGCCGRLTQLSTKIGSGKLPAINLMSSTSSGNAQQFWTWGVDDNVWKIQAGTAFGGPGITIDPSGNLNVTGSITAGTKDFKIDHPLDPENKYLVHASIESSEMMNIYNGNVVLDRKGEAWVDLPDWFEALNRDFRYQLTAIGAPGPNLYVAKKVGNNRFKIAGGKPGSEVSWQVSGVRHDAYAESHRMQVEEMKSEAERGTYLRPELFRQAHSENRTAAVKR